MQVRAWAFAIDIHLLLSVGTSGGTLRTLQPRYRYRYCISQRPETRSACLPMQWNTWARCLPAHTEHSTHVRMCGMCSNPRSSFFEYSVLGSWSFMFLSACTLGSRLLALPRLDPVSVSVGHTFVDLRFAAFFIVPLDSRQ